MNNDLSPIEDKDAPTAGPNSIIAKNSAVVASQVRIARFRNRPMLMVEEPYPHFVPLNKDKFDALAYPILGGVGRSRMSDVFAYVSNTAEDLTVNDRYVLFGLPSSPDAQVWDMQELTLTSLSPDAAIWRSPYTAVPSPALGSRIPFIMSLAGNDPDVYDDIMQSLAPLIMEQKPDGVIWWVGDGANGKSTLMDAIYKLFPGQLSSITVKRLADGRDTPSLNGTLANVVKESSEGRIEDTEIYKAIGTHENFRVHRFHSQDDIEIRGNLHHIFSGNAVPVFNDKGFSARRRTFIVPFNQTFESDPTFESRTFTVEMFGRLITEMQVYAVRLRNQGYKYKWSATTLVAKSDYDTDANNAEEYAKAVIRQGVVAFDTFQPIKMDYENWCSENGYVPLGITNLRRAIFALGFERMTVRTTGTVGGEGTRKMYKLPLANAGDLQAFGMGRPGLYSQQGFQVEEPTEVTIEVPDFPADPEFDDEGVTPETPNPGSILKGKW